MKKKKYILFFLFLSIFLPNISLFSSIDTISLRNEITPKKYSTPSSGAINTYWENNGTVIVNIENNYEFGYKLCTDGAGGAIITWLDERNGGAPNSDIFAQKFDSSGKALWTANGTVICNNTGTQGDVNEYFEEIDICSDKNGGAIITWKDKRNEGAAGGDIYAQRIDSNGKTLWTKNGTVICNSTNLQKFPKIITDEKGGAIITWQHVGALTTDIHAQRINSTGHKQWGAINDYNGTVICNNIFGEKRYPRICSDKNEGAIITWYDFRSTIDLDIYAQRINSTGHIQWGENGDLNGTLICNAANDQGAISVNDPGQLDICCDENGGAVITWYDERDDTDGDIYAQKVNSTGHTKWTENGTLICNKAGLMNAQHNPKICSDDNGGAIITWVDHRDEGGPENRDKDIYAQLINSLGQTKWTDNGTAVCNKPREQNNPQICKDGKGGAFITWEDYREILNGYDIYVQGIDSNENIQGTINGTLICNGEGDGTDDQREPQICSDLTGDPIIVWNDLRDLNSGKDLYAQRLNYLIKKGVGIIIDDDDDDKDKKAPIVPFGNFYLVFLAIGIVILSIYTIRKIKFKK